MSILGCKFDGLTAMIGLLCSSWVVINAGTSSRDVLLPLGDPTAPSVAFSNLMTSRMGIRNDVFLSSKI